MRTAQESTFKMLFYPLVMRKPLLFYSTDGTMRFYHMKCKQAEKSATKCFSYRCDNASIERFEVGIVQLRDC